MSFREQLKFLRHLGRLYEFKLGSVVRLGLFGLVGMTGFVIDIAGYWGLQSIGFGHQIARLMSFWPAATWNWWLNRRVTFEDRPKRPWVRQWIEFVGSSLLGFGVNVGAYLALTETVGFFDRQRLLAFACGVILGACANFLTATKFVYRIDADPRSDSDSDD